MYCNTLPNLRARKKRSLSLDFSLSWWVTSWPPALVSREECGDAALLVCDASGGGWAPSLMTSRDALPLPPSPDDDVIDLGSRGGVRSKVPAAERPHPRHLRSDQAGALAVVPSLVSQLRHARKGHRGRGDHGYLGPAGGAGRPGKGLLRSRDLISCFHTSYKQRSAPDPSHPGGARAAQQGTAVPTPLLVLGASVSPGEDWKRQKAQQLNHQK